MDPSGLKTHSDSYENDDLKLQGLSNISELQTSDGESITELGNSDDETEEEKQLNSIDGSVNEKSVHIIFVRGESENVSYADNLNSSVLGEGNALCSEIDGKSLMGHLPMQKVRVSAVPCRSVSCPSKNSELGSFASAVDSEKVPEEVEDDFDVSQEMLYEVYQKSQVNNLRKKRKKKVYKSCKACGESVERQDFISHIREHRRRKLEFVSNVSPNVDEQPVKTFSNVVLSSTDMVPSKSNVSPAELSIVDDDNIPQTSNTNSLSDRPFKCSVCSETFRTQSSLTIHFKSHSGECSNSCPVS